MPGQKLFIKTLGVSGLNVELSSNPMQISQIINKAVEGGWKQEELFDRQFAYFPYGMGEITVVYNRIYMVKLKKDGSEGRKIQYWELKDLFIDPEFWQALGRAMGWVEVCDNPDHGFIETMPGEIGRLGCPVCGHSDDYIVEKTRDNWKIYWHKFIDHLANGGNAESYFNEL